jgi:hypothetical protein
MLVHDMTFFITCHAFFPIWQFEKFPPPTPIKVALFHSTWVGLVGKVPNNFIYFHLLLVVEMIIIHNFDTILINEHSAFWEFLSLWEHSNKWLLEAQCGGQRRSSSQAPCEEACAMGRSKEEFIPSIMGGSMRHER